MYMRHREQRKKDIAYSGTGKDGDRGRDLYSVRKKV